MSGIYIVGGGTSGLIANYVFRRKGFAPVVLEPGELGGEFLTGGLRYIHRTDAMVRMVEEFELPMSEYNVKGGIMLRGSVHPYPKHLSTLPPEQSSRIRIDHFRKTRRMEPGKFGERSMNDPATKSTRRRALRCDFEELIKELGSVADVKRFSLAEIDSRANRIRLKDIGWFNYDLLVLTIPLWVIRQMADFYVPHGMAMALNLVHVVPNKDRYSKWDYVYTPYTPSDAVHRFSPSDDGYTLEVNGDWDQRRTDTLDDLAFIFPDGFVVRGVRTGLKGHLLELDQKPEWPSNVFPLGRFAEWNPRGTLDVAYERAERILHQWMTR